MQGQQALVVASSQFFVPALLGHYFGPTWVAAFELVVEVERVRGSATESGVCLHPRWLCMARLELLSRSR